MGQAAAGIAGVIVAGEDLHAQSPGDSPCLLADTAKTDDPHGLLRQLDQRAVPEAPVGAALPPAGVYGVAVAANVVAYFQQQRDGELAHGGGAVSGNVGDGNPPLPGRRRVHDVVTGGQDADEAEIRAGLQHGAADRRLVGEDHRRAGDPADDFRLVVQGGPVVDHKGSQFLYGGPAQIAGVLGISIQYHNFHTIAALLMFSLFA